MRTIRTAFAALSLVAVASGASANLLTNGSFENGASGVAQPGSSGTTLQPGTASATDVAGWTAIAPFGVDHPNPNANVAWLTTPNAFNLTAEDGNDFLDLTGYTDSAPYAGIQQTLTGLTAGGKYKLTFYLGTGFGSGHDVFAGPSAVSVSATSPVPVVFVSQTFSAPATAAWTAEEYDFTAAAATVTINFYGQFSQGGQYIGLDNVDLELASTVTPPPPPVTTVPEPATLALFGLGLTGFALVRRRRRA